MSFMLNRHLGRQTILISPIALLLVFLPKTLSASESSDEIPVPLIVVNAGQRIESNLVEDVIRSLGSPFIRGQRLKRQLKLCTQKETDHGESMRQLFALAQDNFFSGRHTVATTNFNRAIKKTMSNPASYLCAPSLSELVFKSHIYLAVLAKGDNDETSVKEQLKLGAIHSPKRKPSSVDFPPWVLKQFELVLEDTLHKIETGEIKDKTVSYQPHILAHSKLAHDANDLVLLANRKTPLSSLVEDSLALAKSGGWSRILVVFGTPATIELWLVDSEINNIVRKASIVPGDIESVKRASISLVRDRQKIKPNRLAKKKAWYKDVLAWTLVGTGLAAVSTGIALAIKYGKDSSEEPWAQGLIAAGSGITASGVTIFFFPADTQKGSGSVKKNNVAVGMAIGGTF